MLSVIFEGAIALCRTTTPTWHSAKTALKASANTSIQIHKDIDPQTHTYIHINKHIDADIYHFSVDLYVTIYTPTNGQLITAINTYKYVHIVCISVQANKLRHSATA